MATELYGVDARLVESIGSTPVSTETNIIFIGASASGDLNKPYLITNMADYASKLGGAAGDGYNLSEAALAAFNVAGIDKVYMIPVSHEEALTAADYIGDSELYTGAYAIEKLLNDSPSMVNIICAPSITDSTVIDALLGVAKGYWKSFVLYDVVQNADQINESGVVDASEVVEVKQFSDEYADAVWCNVKTSGGYIISGAALRACLMAKADAEMGVPGRCGGNLPINGISGPVYQKTTETTYTHYGLTDITSAGIKIETSAGVYVDWNDNAIYSTTVPGCEPIEIDGKVGIKSVGSGHTGYVPSVKETLTETINVTIPQSAGNEMSADGVCSWINYGGGNWHTWGDHTSAFSAGSISDERGRFDNTTRMLLLTMNRFQYKYRFTIDNPMTLQMRNDVINEQLDYLNNMVAIGALVGKPSVSFKPEDNSIDSISQGRFVWDIEQTATPPFKYGLAKVAHTQAGLSVYITEE